MRQLRHIPIFTSRHPAAFVLDHMACALDVFPLLTAAVPMAESRACLEGKNRINKQSCSHLAFSASRLDRPLLSLPHFAPLPTGTLKDAARRPRFFPH